MTKDTYIRLRCTNEFKAQIEHVSSLRGLSVSNLIEKLLEKEIMNMKDLLVGEFAMNGRFINGTEQVEAIATDTDGKVYIVITPILDASADMDSKEFADYENYTILTEL